MTATADSDRYFAIREYCTELYTVRRNMQLSEQKHQAIGIEQLCEGVEQLYLTI